MNPGDVHEHPTECPYCGAALTLLIDPDEGDTDYIEDCAVCCAPMEVAVRWPLTAAEPTPEVALRRADD